MMVQNNAVCTTFAAYIQNGIVSNTKLKQIKMYLNIWFVFLELKFLTLRGKGNVLVLSTLENQPVILLF